MLCRKINFDDTMGMYFSKLPKYFYLNRSNEPEAYSEPCQTSKMSISILNVWQGSEHASVNY